MAEKDKVWLTTKYPNVIFGDNEVGRMKKALFESPMSKIDAILDEYEIPSASELGKAGCYIQNTPPRDTRRLRSGVKMMYC